MSVEHKEDMRSQEQLSSDVRAFCALVARILIRCLQEKNPCVMGCLALSSELKDAEAEGTHDAA
jgi:hypothetical protein